MNDLVSIIVPVYNMANLIDKCAKSLVNQTYLNIEIILVDDGSTDESGVKIDIWASVDKRIVAIHHEENKGIACGFISGLNAASGNYILFVDSDNFVSEKIVDNLLRCSHIENADIVQCEAFCYTKDEGLKSFNGNVSIETFPIQKKDIFSDFFSAKRITNNLAAKLFRRELFENIEIPEGRQIVDIIMFPQLLQKCNSYVCTNEQLYFAYQAPNSVSRSSISERRLSDLEFGNQFYNNFIERYCPEFIKYVYYNYSKTAIWAYNGIFISNNFSGKGDLLKKYKKIFKDNYSLAKKTSYYKDLTMKIRVKWLIFQRCYPVYYILLSIIVLSRKCKGNALPSGQK